MIIEENTIMSKTDPLALLQSKSVEQRAKATRFLEKHGGLKDIDVLLEYAENDPSVAIRNNAADAISDILSRHRVGENKKKLSRKKRLDLMKRFRKVSPNKSPVVYLMYASLGIPEALSIIIAAFFDPRTELRISAAIGLKCYCLSIDMIDDHETEEKVVSMLSNSRLEGDSIAHISRVCAEAGYLSALPILDGIYGEGLIGETIKAATEQLRKAKKRPIGIWISDGLDSMEYNPLKVTSKKVAVIGADSVMLQSKGKWQMWRSFGDQSIRQLLFRRISNPAPGPALQVGDRTWYLASADETDSLLQAELDLEGERCKSLEVLADLLVPKSAECTKMSRNLALLYLRAGSIKKADKSVQRSIDLKRPPRDIYFIKAELKRITGDSEGAETLYQQCISNTRSEKSALAILCKKRLQQMES